MPWCSGKVTVPFGCSTALVMNRRPGHAPQPLPPAVDALAGMAAALAEMAIAISAMRPSAILTNLILRNLVIFTAVLSSGEATNLVGDQRPPAVSLALLVSQRPGVLTSSCAETGVQRRIPRRHEAGRG